jgi:hypothetical protein
MSTFAELEDIARRTIGQEPNVNVQTLLREAENDYCERTWCKEKIDVIDTSTTNSGILSATYALPSDFIREFRIEWNGSKLEKAHIKDGSLLIYDTADNYMVGWPESYLIENGLLRIIPKMSGHGYIGRWYAVKNTDTASVSPIIPEIEHLKLVNYAVYYWYEMNGIYDKAQYYENKYLRDCSAAYTRYKARRGRQARLIDPRLLDWGFGRIGGAANIVQETAVSGAATVFREQQARSLGIPATGDPLDLFKAGTYIVHTLTNTTYTSIPVVLIENYGDWPLFIDKNLTNLSNGIVTVYVGIGGQGTATTLDYTLNVV